MAVKVLETEGLQYGVIVELDQREGQLDQLQLEAAEGGGLLATVGWVERTQMNFFRTQGSGQLNRRSQQLVIVDLEGARLVVLIFLWVLDLIY